MNKCWIESKFDGFILVKKKNFIMILFHNIVTQPGYKSLEREFRQIRVLLCRLIKQHPDTELR